MSLSAALIAEFDHEMSTTRKLLERLDEARLGWKPHEKSMSAGRLASHIAELPGWPVTTVRQDELDFAPKDGPAWEAANYDRVADILERFDREVKAGREALGELRDEDAGKPWSLMMGGEVLFTIPKAAVLRTWVLNHIVHHRGQLSVYLRQLDIPVPSIYGPSADEGGM